MGFAHAQDRLFQMNIHRKIPQGKMAELFGEKLVETDKLLRTFGLARSAKEMEKTLSNEEREYLQAYADGINSFVEQQYILPLEFILTGIEFEKWEIYDTLCFIKLLNFMLSLDWRAEMIRTNIQQYYGRNIADYIIPNMGKYMINDVTIMNEEDLKQMNLYEKFEYEKIVENEPKNQNITISKENMDKIIQMKMPNYLHELYMTVGGSNAWVISGEHTKSGKPLLSNDPHLEVKIPSIWHISHLSYYDNTGKKQIRSGGAMAGGGGVYFSGKSDYFAFGLTTLCADTVDLYYETIDNNKYLYEEQWHNLTIINEKIKVKGQKDSVDYEVKLTNKGPLLEPEQFKNLDKVVSWSWAGDSGRDTTYLAVIKLMDAQNLEDINEGFRQITGPPQAVVYATVDGDIGFYGTGRIPEKYSIKNKGYILDGTKKINTWKRYVPKEEQPRLINPKKGYIVVANNKIAPDDMKNFYTYNMMTTNRAHRIEELILEKIKKGLSIGSQYDKNTQYLQKLIF
ncbi:hypothetical protein PPERSA_01097 [Pseudocohnilembus persalinus]|uniref:Uncharacterized protein n=1 Tax=Pseudocohnilembus persalinus TaxID=266149 RepID=A0A0V0QUC2_PSEPJ|nr:hypothetical protein PPERSA_01097 [Pseudocohnilembus persalinus]|eukprot:KRX06019.1 hypothetical protein PPERSA_01097 [Pseudocohnilembus persalinus]